MKVVHVIDSLDPAAGGPPVICASLAAAQARLGHDVRIVTRSRPGAGGPDCGDAIAAPAGVRVERLPPAGRVERVLGRAAAAALAPHVDWCDFAHLHNVWESILRAAGAACRRAGRPYAVLLNGMLDPWSLAQKRWKKRLAMALAYRRLLDGAAFLHLGNEDERRLIAPLGLRAPGRVIPNGVTLEAIDPLPSAGEFGAPRPYVLFLGRLHYKKGLDVLADAFARLAAKVPAVHLVVAGPDEGARADFEARVGVAGCADRVRLVGPLYGRAKWAALAGAAVFCLPSRQEGFSVAILEALAARVPVVASEACHFPEVAEVGAGRVVPLDAAAVAAALGDVLADAARRARMGAAGRALVEGRFTWAKAAAQSLEAYERAR